MADYQYPNRIRAYTALLIYRDALIPFIEAALGPERIRRTLFNSDTQLRNPQKYEIGMRELNRGTPVSDLIDQTDIPLLVEYHLGHFSSLNNNNIGQMRSIRQLWNDKIKHDIGLGDCKADIADKCVDLCIRVLRRCGLGEAADKIASLSSPMPTTSTPATDATVSKLAQPGNNIKPPPDWSTADPSQQLHHQTGFPHPVQPQLASSMSHDLVLREDGSVTGWGGNDYGQCDAPDGKFKAISAGENHSIGLREDGSVECWGDNRFGQCGAPDSKFKTVSAGGHHSIGLREDGFIECWGDNRFGQRDDAPDGKFVAISAGENHSLGLREDGSVAGWGDNNDRQCNAPDDKFIAVSAGGYHSLGLREDGFIAHWGWQEDGRGNPPEGNFLP